MSQDPLSVSAKVAIAKEKKEVGDQSFKAGDFKAALQSYHQALMYLVGLDRNAIKSLTGGLSAPTPPLDGTSQMKEEKTEVDEIVEKVYANMSACHLNQKNWQRALETADKALKKNENNYKAMFRKGKALGEIGYFEKAQAILEDLKKKNPTDAAGVDRELARLKAIDMVREKAHRDSLRGFLKKSEPESNERTSS
jgi:tetratricopeptide (TPR) repeat protein